MIVLAGAGKSFRRNGRDLAEIAAAFFGPIEHDHRGRHFREAADLALFSRVALLDDVAGLGIDDDVGLCRTRGGGGSADE